MPTVRDAVRERRLRVQPSAGHHSSRETRRRRGLGARRSGTHSREEGLSRMFRCIRCGEALPSDANLFGVRCDNCGGKIFTKEHPNVKKTLKAR